MQVETNEDTRVLVFGVVKIPLVETIYEIVDAVQKLTIEQQHEIIVDAGLEVRADVSKDLTYKTAMSIVQNAWFSQRGIPQDTQKENHAIRLERYRVGDPSIVKLGKKRPRKTPVSGTETHPASVSDGKPRTSGDAKHGAALRALIAAQPNLTRAAAQLALSATTGLPLTTTGGAVRSGTLERSGVRVNPTTKFLELVDKPKFESFGMSLREDAEAPLKKSDFSANDQWAFLPDETPEQFLFRTGKSDPRRD